MKKEVLEFFTKTVEQYQGRFVVSPDKPNESAEATVRSLWLCAAGNPVSADAAMALDLPALNPESHQKLTELLDRRLAGTPLAYLTGRQRFMGLEYACSNQALIPRKETEILGEAVCDLLTREILPNRTQPQVLDLCTGSGNLACAIATRCPTSVVFGVDISAEAIQLAAVNAKQLGCSDRVRFSCGDLFQPFETEEFAAFFDLIVCNPPYIDPSRLSSMNPEIIAHEPKLAFDGGPLGVRILLRLLHEAPRFLKSGGWLAFEVGLGQGNSTLKRLSKDTRFTGVKGFSDPKGNVRAIMGQFRGDAHGSGPGLPENSAELPSVPREQDRSEATVASGRQIQRGAGKTSEP